MTHKTSKSATGQHRGRIRTGQRTERVAVTVTKAQLAAMTELAVTQNLTVSSWLYLQIAQIVREDRKGGASKGNRPKDSEH